MAESLAQGAGRARNHGHEVSGGVLSWLGQPSDQQKSRGNGEGGSVQSPSLEARGEVSAEPLVSPGLAQAV